MSDDCIATAREIINARLRREHDSFNSDLQAVKFDYANRGILNSSMYPQKVREICTNHLQKRAQIIFESLEKNLAGHLVLSPELKQKLKAEFLTHLDAHANMILAASMDHSIHLVKNQLVAEYNAEIDRLCRKLESDANKPLSQIVINNLTQSGQGNQAIQGSGNTFSGSISIENPLPSNVGTILAELPREVRDQIALDFENFGVVREKLRELALLWLTDAIEGLYAGKVFPDEDALKAQYNTRVNAPLERYVRSNFKPGFVVQFGMWVWDPKRMQVEETLRELGSRWIKRTINGLPIRDDALNEAIGIIDTKLSEAETDFRVWTITKAATK